MSNTILIALTTIMLSLAIGATGGYMYKTEADKSLVEIHATKTGSFILVKDRIYTVSELQTDEVQTGTMGRK
jgi:hypothetical protein